MTVQLDVDECATALFLDEGNVGKAAARLKVPVTTLNRCIRKWPQLQRLIATLRDSDGGCAPATGA
jgi:hypothetical protein